ncbi:hypothetical protein HT136_02785 [Novosphingobium profundi]|nr:hypothetical protein [Novosphingobium profundi]MBT0667292.1 hypothetical protein [Novosphingobium profundi]
MEIEIRALPTFKNGAIRYCSTDLVGVAKIFQEHQTGLSNGEFRMTERG